MRILYSLCSLYGYDGYSMLALDGLRQLTALGHEVDCAVLVERRDAHFETANQPLRESARKIFFHDHPLTRGRLSRFSYRIGNRAAPRQVGGRHFCPPGYWEELASRFDLSEYHLAIAATAKFARLPEVVECPTVVDLHELFSHKVKVLARHGIPLDSPYANLAEEIEAIRRFDLSWCPSTYIRRVLERVLPATIHVDRHLSFEPLIPPGYTPPGARPSGTPRLLFVGSTAAENQPGMVAFVDEIFPEIRRSVPDAEFHVIGWRPEDFLPGVDLSGIVAHGLVPSREEVLRLFAETDVVVIPRFLGGLTIKGVESLCLGKVTIGHAAAFSGCYTFENWKTAVVVEDNREFAAATVRLLGDPGLRRQIAAHAWSYSQDRFHPERAYADLFEGLCALRNRSHPTRPIALA